MKKRFLTLMLTVCVSVSLFAFDYETTMKENIATMYKTTSVDSLTNLSASFYRIAQISEKEWLPYYYASYCYVAMTYNEKDTDKIDVRLDKAQEYLNMALKINDGESELYVLQGLIHSLRITNAGRGYKYSTLSNDALAKAEAFNSKNPRVFFCRAQNMLHTPAMFGGGKKNALPLFEKAAQLFEQQATNDITPDWGEKRCLEMIDYCRKLEKE